MCRIRVDGHVGSPLYEHGVIGQYRIVSLYPGMSEHQRVEDRVDEHLIDQSRTAWVARHECDHGSEVSACAITAHSDAIGIAADLGGMIRHPFRGRKSVIGSRGKMMLRRQSVAHRDDQAIATISYRT